LGLFLLHTSLKVAVVKGFRIKRKKLLIIKDGRPVFILNKTEFGKISHKKINPLKAIRYIIYSMKF